MKKLILGLLFLLSGSGVLGQAKPPASESRGAGGFPAQLLDGMQDFVFALQFFADSRGNFGPCG